MTKITVSAIKADIGGCPGHVKVHQNLIDRAEECIEDSDLLEDYWVTNCGDDLQLIMTHREGEDSNKIHELAWDTFQECTELAKEMKLYGAGQDLLTDTFSGNVKGAGPGSAEIEFEERASDPLIIFMADKTEPGAWNLPLYKIFADPFNTAGLVISPSMSEGFTFEIHDIEGGRRVKLHAPEEIYDILAILGTISRYCVKRIWKDDVKVCASSTERLNQIAGEYVGKDDPVCIVRAQHGFPAVGEILEPFANPHLVGGWMRGSHNAPLMPVAFEDAHPTRFDGPPRVIAAGFQVTDGELIGPQDLFDDPAFDPAREKANTLANELRKNGPFEPHRLPSDEMEYTTLPEVQDKLEDRWESVE
ncbi:fructose 1,6-bisphosphatase [candidate division MSBL1 archaeon SCGC-AAA259I09]|uniref:Fructose-1,6-bisphosphate aldolase/phosphatase n=1 Tax=candidate division MSBL1 archaeon SCGC-AAA259I09 TaxID=1698267 RepID=A0A133UU80_9EURY|nr:fructose 1,6-bisphosphatase [candidate division MSBL1 archaeon SCGC-AAA259I09]